MEACSYKGLQLIMNYTASLLCVPLLELTRKDKNDQQSKSLWTPRRVLIDYM